MKVCLLLLLIAATFVVATTKQQVRTKYTQFKQNNAVPESFLPTRNYTAEVLDRANASLEGHSRKQDIMDSLTSVARTEPVAFEAKARTFIHSTEQPLNREIDSTFARFLGSESVMLQRLMDEAMKDPTALKAKLHAIVMNKVSG